MRPDPGVGPCAPAGRALPERAEPAHGTRGRAAAAQPGGVAAGRADAPQAAAARQGESARVEQSGESHTRPPTSHVASHVRPTPLPTPLASILSSFHPPFVSSHLPSHPHVHIAPPLQHIDPIRRLPLLSTPQPVRPSSPPSSLLPPLPQLALEAESRCQMERSPQRRAVPLYAGGWLLATLLALATAAQLGLTLFVAVALAAGAAQCDDSRGPTDQPAASSLPPASLIGRAWPRLSRGLAEAQGGLALHLAVGGGLWEGSGCFQRRRDRSPPGSNRVGECDVLC